MVAFQLDPAHQKRLAEIANARGQDEATLARQVLMDYLDFQALPSDSEDAWAESSIALTPEILGQEAWESGDDGPK